MVMNMFIFKINQEEAPAIYQQLDEESANGIVVTTIIQAKTLGS